MRIELTVGEILDTFIEFYPEEDFICHSIISKYVGWINYKDTIGDEIAGSLLTMVRENLTCTDWINPYQSDFGDVLETWISGSKLTNRYAEHGRRDLRIAVLTAIMERNDQAKISFSV